VRVADGHYALMVAGRCRATIKALAGRRPKDGRAWQVEWDGGTLHFAAFARARDWTLRLTRGETDPT
jgi:hypothetical protein